MKLQSVSVIFVVGLMELAGMANGLCLVRNSTTPNQYWYQCFRSNDYLADLRRAPVDVYGHTVSNSKIRVIRNGSYARLRKSLTNLAVIYSGVEEIENNAFQGLDKLMRLFLTGNKLETIKSGWFAGLSNLKAVSFQSNKIKYVQDDFFAILPRLNVLDITNNQLTCLPTTSFGNFNATEFLFRHNRFTRMCQISVVEWLKNANIRHDYLNPENMDPPYDLVKLCADKAPKLTEGFLNHCSAETAGQLLPAEGDYTVEQVCEFLKGKPSPFLDCTK